VQGQTAVVLAAEGTAAHHTRKTAPATPEQQK